jgi:predicted AAA+ superfamily ATPase
LWGARKTGKSTFLKSLYPQSIYIDLLEGDTLLSYVKNPSRLRHEVLEYKPEILKHPIIIDEIQKIPALLDEIHWLIENAKDQGVHFILCGSSLRRLKMSGSNLLGGRAWRQIFMPLCYPEWFCRIYKSCYTKIVETKVLDIMMPLT